ncbi:acyloxyacyl hydrolase [Flavobacteriaceae bacterium HL-DH10]|uniref:Acyloxyacyl hydrolase n=1 Tax=Thalassobellus suaedae TaxID=3074124 RepID=A0ABY9Y8L2_9FLAO|nr:acyloxyacyl hydrolase [Flavobacteriaceae bacterium HL-DH10]
MKPTDGDDYLEKQALYTQKRTIKEYGLNLGFIARYHIFKTFSGYAIGSIGPMISNKSTERLAKGYAFSDIFGLGLSYNMGKVQFDFRYSVRHTSNLQFKKPNNGHNTTNIEFLVLYKL